MRPPRIGISGGVKLVDGIRRTGVNEAYAQSVANAGGLPILLTPQIPAEHAAAALDGLDGLILSGGEDVDPARYSEVPSPRLGAVDSRRDSLEFALFDAARRRGLPVFAICRGMQVVNVALGGTLYQDIPSEHGQEIRHEVQPPRNTRVHRVRIRPGTRLAHILGITGLDTNTIHHQAIKTLAPGLTVTADADDGVIEGVEGAPDQPWLVAVQWHPEEFHNQADAPERKLFRAFVEEAERRKAGD